MTDNINEAAESSPECQHFQKVSLYGPADVCVICGAYMAEGTGMVCQECMDEIRAEIVERGGTYR